MKASQFVLVGSFIAAGAYALSGCVMVSETHVSDDPRARVAFENDRAARVFYETLSDDAPGHAKTEKHEVVSLILINVDKRTVSGPNRVFNEAVAFCDTDGSGEITEREAGIFSAEWPRHCAKG